MNANMDSGTYRAIGMDIADAAARTMRFGPHTLTSDVTRWWSEIQQCDPTREWVVQFRMVRGKPVGRLVSRLRDVPTLKAHVTG